MERTVWQPERLRGSYEFAVRLDGDFGRDVLRADPPSDYQEVMDRQSRELMEERDIFYPGPVRFYGESMYATGFHVGRNGTWLSLRGSPERQLVEREQDSVRYDSHNVDTAEERDVLLTLFGNWAEKTETLL